MLGLTMKLHSVGTRLINRQNPTIVIEIVDVRDQGYGWKYAEWEDTCPNGSENYFWSENSSDPALSENMWKPQPPTS